MRAEWTKLRTLQSTGWLLLGLAVSTAGIGALTAWSVPTECLAPEAGCREDIARYSLAGVYLGQIAVVVLATLAVTAEYGTQTIKGTLAAEPRRGWSSRPRPASSSRWWPGPARWGCSGRWRPAARS
ncbi:hypothetical protein [Phytohabitans rumicis]|uniref:Uncharacterized protein n=1 Tax=Phytohabitans rumicis TaxID=1076125 RepID=A0A6V8L2B4_9ACTN|nr:hypothetical protein [Phytohabitans rumicis]GFJ91433.1 hypothetical protein Prum_050750 [Phytohabitans rumicis]